MHNIFKPYSKLLLPFLNQSCNKFAKENLEFCVFKSKKKKKRGPKRELRTNIKHEIKLKIELLYVYI